MYVIDNNKTRKYLPAINIAAFNFATLSATLSTLLALSLITSCSSISRDTRSAISIESNVPVICKFSDAMDIRILRTPDTIYVDAKNEPAQLTCKKNGYRQFIKSGIKGTEPEYKYPQTIVVTMLSEDPDMNIPEQDTETPIATLSLSLNGTVTAKNKVTTHNTIEEETPAEQLNKPVALLDASAKPIEEQVAPLDEAAKLLKKPVNSLDKIATSPPSINMDDNIKKELSESEDETTNSILSKDPAHYTLQFFSMKNESNANRGMTILQKHNLGNQAMQFSYASGTGQLHKVIYGDYETVAAAKEMLQSLPEELQNLKPWIRNISTIQNNIRMSSSE